MKARRANRSGQTKQKRGFFMPIVDMPLEELKRYGGTNPRPADFDPFWDRSLKEMRAADAQPEFRPADFSCPFADCFDFTFTGVRGARIYAKFARPKHIEGKAPAVLMFHGYSGDSGDWTGLLPYAAAGFVAAALDCRGQGGKSEDTGGVTGNTLFGDIIRGLDDGPENMLMRHIFLDTAQLAELVMALPYVDENRVGAFGGSQGGGLTLACASLEPRVSRIVAQMPFLCDYKRVWSMDLDKDAYQEIKDYFRHFDPRHLREDEVFTRLGYVDVEFLTPRIRAKTIMATGLLDTVCPPSTQFAAYNRITSEKSLLLYPDFTHEGYPGLSDLIFEFMMKLAE